MSDIVQKVDLWLCVYISRAAAMTLRTVLLSLQALLAAAEPDDPQDAVVANQVGADMHLIFFFYFHAESCMFIL